MQYISALVNVFKTIQQKTFAFAYTRGNLMVLKNLYYKYIDIHALQEDAFNSACKQNRIDILEFLISLEPTNGEIDIHINSEEFLYNAVEAGNLNIIKYLISLEPSHGMFALQSNDDNILSEVYDIEILKYLISLEPTHGMFDIHIYSEKLFRNACAYKTTEMVEYMISLEPTHGLIDIHASDELAFINACSYGRIDIAKYLISLEPTHGQINIHAAYVDFYNNLDLHPKAFTYASKYGHAQIVKFLFSLEATHGAFNIHRNDDEAFKFTPNFQIRHMLVKKDPEYNWKKHEISYQHYQFELNTVASQLAHLEYAFAKTDSDIIDIDIVSLVQEYII